MGHLGQMIQGLGKYAAQVAQHLPFEPELFALQLAQRLGLHGDEVGVATNARANGEPFDGQACLVRLVANYRGAQRGCGVGGEDLILLSHGVDGHVGKMLHGRDADGLASGQVMRNFASHPSAQSRVEDTLANAHDHLAGVEEVEHVSEVGNEQQEAGAGHQQGHDDGDARYVVAGDRERDPNRVETGHHEEADDG